MIGEEVSHRQKNPDYENRVSNKKKYDIKSGARAVVIVNRKILKIRIWLFSDLNSNIRIMASVLQGPIAHLSSFLEYLTFYLLF